MIGMISAGAGFLSGVWIWRRLQRAFRYGMERVASRAVRSSRVFGNGSWRVSMGRAFVGFVQVGFVEVGCSSCSSSVGVAFISSFRGGRAAR